MKLRLILIIALTSTLFTACKKKEERLITKEEKRLEGTWNIDENRTLVTDSMGVTISDSTEYNNGIVKFIIATEDGADVFNKVLFDNITGSNALAGYFQGLGCGSGTVNGGWAFFWDADPNAKRILFWGIASGGSYHKTVNMEPDGKNKMTWTYIQTYYNDPNTRTFYSFKLSK